MKMVKINLENRSSIGIFEEVKRSCEKYGKNKSLKDGYVNIWIKKDSLGDGNDLIDGYLVDYEHDAEESINDLIIDDSFYGEIVLSIEVIEEMNLSVFEK